MGVIGSDLYATRKLAIYFSDMFHRIFDVNNNNNVLFILRSFFDVRLWSEAHVYHNLEALVSSPLSSVLEGSSF